MPKQARKMKIAVVLGTRPEIIKCSALLRLLEKKKADYFLLHTGQHYSYEMDKLFFEELELPEPKHKLSVHQAPVQGHGEHLGRMLAEVERILLHERPTDVLVQGDTNSVLAGALIAAKSAGSKMRVGHIEAGLRSYDRQMPEEINRIVADHISDFLFAPTKGALKILRSEGIAARKIFITGNTIVDAVLQNLEISKKKKPNLPYGLQEGQPFFLMTMHRQENVDHKDRLAQILKGVGEVHRQLKAPIIFPAHPRTVKMIHHFNLEVPQGVQVHPPVGFLDFLRLEAEAKLLLTDSGGVQEEGCILGVPCVTMRTSTERPETVQVGANMLAGFDPKKIVAMSKKMIQKKPNWKNPFGDGRSSERILQILSRQA
jgi:UDP-N-acetylglucosamine 2-epimerase (non-hydrolysing)